MNLKLKGRRFDTITDIQAEPQKVLKTLTEKDFSSMWPAMGRHFSV